MLPLLSAGCLVPAFANAGEAGTIKAQQPLTVQK